MGNDEKHQSNFFGPHTSRSSYRTIARLDASMPGATFQLCFNSLSQHQDPNYRSHVNPADKSGVCLVI